jgi:hypothetical protein
MVRVADEFIDRLTPGSVPARKGWRDHARSHRASWHGNSARMDHPKGKSCRCLWRPPD